MNYLIRVNTSIHVKSLVLDKSGRWKKNSTMNEEEIAYSRALDPNSLCFTTHTIFYVEILTNKSVLASRISTSPTRTTACFSSLQIVSHLFN